MATYDVGENVLLRFQPVDQDGEAVTSLTSITLHIERTDGTVDTVSSGSINAADSASGLWSYQDTAEGWGNTWYRWVAVSSGVTAVDEGFYFVRRQHAVPA